MSVFRLNLSAYLFAALAMSCVMFDPWLTNIAVAQTETAAKEEATSASDAASETVSDKSVQSDEKLAYEDVTAFIKKTEHPRMTTYLIRGPLEHCQVLRLACYQQLIAVGTSRGLLIFDRSNEQWRLYDRRHGIPGDRVYHLGFTDDGQVLMEVLDHDGPHSVKDVGVFRFDLKTNKAVDIHNIKGNVFRIESGYVTNYSRGLNLLELSTGRMRAFDKANSDLQQTDFGTALLEGDRLWVSHYGGTNYKGEPYGGGVTNLHVVTGKGKHYSVEDGLGDKYVGDLAVNRDSVWATHGQEKKGLSVLDRYSDKWTHIKKSNNNLDIGGVTIFLNGEYLWVGQQRGLLRLNTRTMNADRYTERDGLAGYIVSSLVKEGDRLWVASYAYRLGPQALPMGGISLIREPLVDQETD